MINQKIDFGKWVKKYNADFMAMTKEQKHNHLIKIYHQYPEGINKDSIKEFIRKHFPEIEL